MKASEYVKAYGSAGPLAWERAAYELARDGSFVAWPLSPVTLRNDRHVLVVQVSSDVFTLGEPGDALRMPLTVPVAQAICNAFDMLLPTYKLVKDIHAAASVRVPFVAGSSNMVPNRGADIGQYVAHNSFVDAQLRQLALPQGLTSGQGKDYVISNTWKPGKTVIYGWCKALPPPGPDPAPMMDAPWRVQPLMPGHWDGWVDYSQLIRFVSANCTLDGGPVRLESVYTSPDPSLHSLVSYEGQLKMARFPVPHQLPSTPAPYPGKTSLAADGLERIRYYSGTRKT